MKYSKPELTSVLKYMIVESFAFVKAHIDWITSHDLTDPMTDQVSRQLSNHLMVLHWAFPIYKKLFSPEDIIELGSEGLLSKIELIYIEGLKAGHVLKCECDYCKPHLVVEEPIKKEEPKKRKMKVRYGN